MKQKIVKPEQIINLVQSSADNPKQIFLIK